LLNLIEREAAENGGARGEALRHPPSTIERWNTD
jgi:hypothetical protein